MEGAPKAAHTSEQHTKSEEQEELLLTEKDLFKGDFEHISSSEEFLSAVDFKTLNEIFDALETKSSGEGVIKNSGHSIDPKKIHFSEIIDQDKVGPSEILEGSTRVSKGEISLKWEHGTGTRIQPAKVLSRLLVLAHEATHLRGGYDHEIYSYEDDSSTIYARHTAGLDEVTAEIRGNDITESQVGLNLSEAITEDIAHQVFREYLLRTGNGSYLKDQTAFSEIRTGGYTMERLALAVVLSVLSSKLEVSQDELRRGFVQAYMSRNHDVAKILMDIGLELWDNAEAQRILRYLKLNIDFDEAGLSIDSMLDAIADSSKDFNESAKEFSEVVIKDPVRALELLDTLHELTDISRNRTLVLENLDVKIAVLQDSLGLRNT